MKSYGLYISLSLMAFFVAYAKLAENQAQSELYRYKSELCKYYVACFAAKTVADYYENVARDTSTVEDRIGSLRNVRRRTSLGSGINAVLDASLVSDNLFANRLPRKFLRYDVYQVSRLFPSSGSYFKIGIDDQFRFVTFGGFDDPVSGPGDYTHFWGFDDGLKFESSDLPLHDEAEVRQFIGDWIQLTQYEDRAGFFKILSNEYEETKGVVTGACQTAELKQSFSIPANNRIRYREWSYRIPSFGQPRLELISEREEEDLSEILGP